MVMISQLNCQPLVKANQNNISKLAFASEEIKEPKDSVEVSAKADEAEEAEKPAKPVEAEVVEQAEEPGVFKKVANHFNGINWKKAGHQYWQGFTSPIREMINHPAIMGAAVAGGFVLKKVVKDYPRIGILSLAGTVGIAGYNVAKGAYNFVKADNATQKENSFYTLGQGSVYGALAVVPAKAVAKANKDIIPDAENLNHFKALVANLKQAPKAVIDIGKALLNGKGLDTALGAGAVATGTEASTAIDPPEVPINKDDSNMAVFKKLQEGAPDQFQKLVDTARELAGDETGGLAVASNTQGKGAPDTND